MKKILLDFGIPSTKEETQEYIAGKMGFSEKYGKNLDALYDELTGISEPVAVGIFLPVDDYDPDIDLLVYFDSVGEVFSDAERDNPYLAVIFGDITLNPEFEDRFGEAGDDGYEDPYLTDVPKNTGSSGFKAGSQTSEDEGIDEDEMPMIGEKGIILLDIGK